METFSALLTLCARNSLVTGEFPAQWPVTQSHSSDFTAYKNDITNDKNNIQRYDDDSNEKKHMWWFEWDAFNLNESPTGSACE